MWNRPKKSRTCEVGGAQSPIYIWMGRGRTYNVILRGGTYINKNLLHTYAHTKFGEGGQTSNVIWTGGTIKYPM